MSQAEALLNTLSETPVEHKHSVPDSDTYFLINPYTREIENTAYNKTVLMRGDHNSERFTFEIPRYVDGHDMSLCNRVIVHFDNVGESVYDIYSDVAYTDDLRINPDNIDTVICSWLIKREATQHVGILSFSLQYQCGEGEEITYEWNTDSYDEIEIRKSKNNGEGAVIQYTNVLEEWRSRLFGAGDSVMANITSEGANQVAAVKNESATQQAAIELKGSETLATIPDDYTELYNMAEEALRTKADGIACEVEGNAIIVNDSSDDYIRGLNVYGKSTQVTTTGKNLFDVSKIANNNRVTNTNGAITVNTPEGSSAVDSMTNLGVIAPELEVGKSYTLTFETTGTDRFIYLEEAKFMWSNGGTNTVTQEMLDSDVLFYASGVSTTATLTNFMLRDSTIEDSSYEPYTGGIASPSPDYPQEIVSIENPTVAICGKNLINVIAGGVATGVTETVHDGLVDFSGTATGSGGRALWKRSDEITLYPGTYTMRLTYSSGTAPTACLSKTGTHALLANGNDTTFTVDEITTVFLGFNYIADRTYNAVNVGVQLEVGDTATEYVPYVESQVLAIEHTLHGIPVTSGGNYIDSDGQQWICDEVDLERGVRINRLVKKTFSGSTDETWRSYNTAADSTHTAYQESKLCTDMQIFSGSSNDVGFILSDKYAAIPLGDVYSKGTQGIAVSNANPTIRMCVDECQGYSYEEFKEWLKTNPFELLYPLATPIETPLTADEIEIYKSLKTNYPSTTVLNSANAMMKLKYNADTKLYIDNASIDGAASVVEEIINETY